MTAEPTVATPARAFQRADVSRWGLWFGLAGGVVAWLLHFLLAYAISEFGCVGGWDRINWAGLTAITWSLLAVTVLGVGLAGASVLIAARARKRLEDQHLDAPGEPGVAAAGFWMAWTGYMVGLVSLVVIVVQSIPILYWLGDC